MHVSVETVQGLERRMTVSIPAEKIEKTVADRLKSLCKTVRLDGFRPGKVPLSVVVKRFGGAVRLDVEEEVIKSSLAEAATQQKLRPAGPPQVGLLSSSQASADGEFRFEAVFEVYPEVQVVPKDELSIDKPDVEITESDIDDVIEKLRRQHQEWALVERPAQKGDRCVIDFRGQIEGGEEFTSDKTNGAAIVIGNGENIEEFEEQLVGIVAGEEKSIPVAFPESHPNARFSGKTITFQVKARSVEEGQLPEVDGEFIALFGIKDGTLAEFRDSVRRRVIAERDSALKKVMKARVMDVLYQNYPIPVPNCLVDQEMEHYSSSHEGGEGVKSDIRELAKRRVALGILFAEVVKTQGIGVTPEQIKTYIATMAEDFESPAALERWYLADPKRTKELEVTILEDSVVDWVLSFVRINPVSVPFKDFLASAS